MSHRFPEAPQQLQWQAPAHRKTLSFTLRLITPMFGGGYEPAKVDLDNPIRAAAIRGHLRFWWRATAGAQYPTLRELAQAEALLWGSTDRPGAVITRTALTPDSQQRLQRERTQPQNGLRPGTCLPQCAEFVWNREQTELKALPEPQHGFPAYALQPFQGERDSDRVNIKTDPATGLVDLDFELLLTFPAEHQAAVVSAVSALVRYGGLGARTRRGCGSLKLLRSDLNAVPEITLATPAPNLPDDLTLLQDSTLLLGNPRQDPISAWYEAVSLYQEFRQTGPLARDPGPGRSHWPEPNTIRHKIDPRRAWAHAIPPNFVAGFPRADLGLPIIFHFKDENSRDRTDPKETTLEADREQARRFASPIITKAVPEGNQYRPMVLILNAPHAWHYGDIVLKPKDGGPAIPISKADIEMTPTDRAAVEPLAGKPVREALEEFLRAKRWTQGAIR